MALHLHDNGDMRIQHWFSFDDNIDWQEVIRIITLTDYQGSITMEPMNCDYKD